MSKTIRLVVFNESYWGKGLIYSQNILPLKKLANETGSQIELFSFTSILKLFLERKSITEFRVMMAKEGVTVKNFPVFFYPARVFLLRYFLIPYFYMNVAPYVWFLRNKDKNIDVVYNLRSYATSLAFYKFYHDYNKLIFDPRTDWIEENVNAGNIKPEGETVRFWNRMEGEFVRRFKKSIFTSETFRDNVITKHNIKETDKYEIVYNPIDYSLFTIEKVPHMGKCFLYTGSFGRWNKLETYLDFFKSIFANDSTCSMVICTSSSHTKVEKIISSVKYNSIRNAVKVYYNVSIDDLPKYYAMCDYGLQLMTKKDSRVGVKYVEYVAAGITPIVSENVQGAAYIARKYSLGIVLPSDINLGNNYTVISEAKTIDVNSISYNKFRDVSDLNRISQLLKHIYFY